MNRHSATRHNQSLLCSKILLTIVLALSVFSSQAQVPDSFDPNVNIPLANALDSLIVEPNGSILLGGTFTNISLQPRYYAGRVNQDGALDLAFNPAADRYVFSIARQLDGRTLFAGSFTNFAGMTNGGIVRLKADGSLDPTFLATCNGGMMALAFQPDDKILAGGAFTILNGQVRRYLARLNVDGSTDSTFSADITSSGTSRWVTFLTLQSDGKILVVGQFDLVGGLARTNFARLNSNGTVDANFNPLSSGIESVTVQTNGQILVGGLFNSICGQPWTNLARLNADGTLDTSFNPHPNGNVSVLTLQADGKILVAGAFGTLADQVCTRMGRLNPDGTVDSTFNTTVSDFPSVLALQKDGRILVGGRFVNLGGAPRNRLGRLINTDPATESIAVTDETITWMRGGTGPEVNATEFAISPDGTNWVSVGKGQRIAGGWQLGGSGFTTNEYVRARGIVTSETSSWYIESIRGSLKIITSPMSRTDVASTVAEFRGAAIGEDPISYQWFKAGVALTNAANLFGATTPTLVVTNVLGVDGGDYFLVASNLTGSVTSQVATLTVIDPVIVLQPVSKATNVGQTISFQVQAVGTAPLVYQWRRDGLPLAGQTLPTLTLTNVQLTDIASYDVWVTNSYGIATSTVATLTVFDPAIVVQPASKATNAGQTVSFNVDAVGTPLLSYQWRKNGLSLPGRTTTTLTVTNIQNADIASYDVLVANSYGAVTSAIATLTFLSTPDSLNITINVGSVYATALQRDGKMLVGGSFLAVTGQTRNGLARFNADGTLDTSFNPLPNHYVFSMIVQPDDKILVCGWFSSIGGQNRTYLARLMTNGIVETNFNANVVGGAATQGVYSMALRPNGKILIAGGFTSAGGQSRTNIAQLNVDGTLDTSFNPSANDLVYPLIVQPDGRVVVGGNFTNLCGVSRQHIGRLNEDGTLDVTFNPGTDNLPLCFALQPDAKILVGGSFTSMGGQSRTNLARLNADGTIDADFSPHASSLVRSMSLQADGKIIVGGNFITLAGQTNRYIGRLLSNGTSDPTFVAGFFGNVGTPAVYSTMIQPDGKVLVGGDFYDYARRSFARLNATDPARESLAQNGSSLQWIRGGTVPQASLTTFDAASGTNWTSGTATWTNGAWEMPGLSTNMTCRIRGFFSGGRYGSSSWVSEYAFGPPRVFTQPLSRTNSLGTTASFGVTAVGAGPLVFQWYKEGLMLTNSSSISGATTSSLSVGSLAFGNGGDYWVVVSNSYGTITSAIAKLTLLDPVISVQPRSQTNNAGLNTAVYVVASGTAPLRYQWYKDGIQLVNSAKFVGAQSATMTVTGLLHADMGSYSAIVSNISGFVSSEVAALTVVDPYISVHPASKTVNGGTNAVLNVVAAGSALNYQWRKDGVDLAVGKAASLNFTNAQWLDRGSYNVVVSNSFGSLTSSVAVLNVVFPYPAAFVSADGSLGFSSNQFGFNLRGNSGQVIVIDGSTNLTSWTPLRTNTFGFGSFYFSDPESTNSFGRFYRARVP
ncbi:MAG: Ig family protein [Verrucomicrobiales bacterium]|nr:Ig family protein [Verrucomicrobiales bacterium]